MELGKKTLIVGEGHDVLMGVVGFILAFFVLKLDVLGSFYLAIGLALSSTIVVVKALTNRKELATPHGKILIGTMVLQDIVAMVSLAVFSSIGTGATILSGLGFMFLKGFLVFAFLLMLGRYILPKVFIMLQEYRAGVPSCLGMAISWSGCFWPDWLFNDYRSVSGGIGNL